MSFARLAARRILPSFVVAVVALSLTTGALAANDGGQSAASAVPLSNVATGHIVGSSAGSFGYYSFYYRGDGSVGTLTFSIHPVDPVTEGFLGINLYQAGNLLANASAVGPTPGVNAVTFSSTTAGPVLVQVWDYGNGVAADYQLQLSGVNQTVPTPAPTVVATPVPVDIYQLPTSTAAGGDGSPAKPYVLNGTVSGTLPGNVAGRFVYYSLPYPGDGSTQNLQFDFSPGGRETGIGVFVTVYQNGTQLTTVQAVHNQGNAPGIVPVTYSSTVAGPVLIQLGNYNQMTTISYMLSR